MFENKFTQFLEDFSYLHFGLLFLLSSIIVILITSLFAKSSMFVISFLSLMLCVPISRFLKREDEFLLENNTSILIRFEKEIFLFWIIFILSIFIFYVLNILGFEFLYQEKVYETFKTGKFIALDSTFLQILLNNLLIMVLTFGLTFIISSSLIFILLWNASVISHFLYNITNALSTSLLILPHILFESGGYILAGFAGILLYYRLTHFKKNKYFLTDFIVLIILALLFILIAAILETL